MALGKNVRLADWFLEDGAGAKYNASIIAVDGQTWFAKLLKKFQTENGNLGAASHLAVLFMMSPALAAELESLTGKSYEHLLNRPCVVEAHWRVRILPWYEFHQQRNKDRLWLVYTHHLSMSGRTRLMRHILTYIDEWYSIKRLVVLGITKLTGIKLGVKVKGDRPICSYLVSKPYYIELGIEFDGAPYRSTTPDDVMDHAKASADWEVRQIV